MGEGIAFPLPVFRARGRPFWESFRLLFGFSGFPITRHVYLELTPGVKWFAIVLKVFLLGMYFVYQFYIEKGYLRFSHTQGISRMQVQHPVDGGCNPLTEHSEGCRVKFKSLEDLPYCSQFKNKIDNAKLPDCEYFDEFDIRFDSGYQQKTMMLPTRRSTYSQNIDCSDKGSLKPCPTVDKFKKEHDVYFADVEDFTLLIDHSMVNEELNLARRAWDMIGFLNPCGTGKELEQSSLARLAAEETGATKLSFLGESKPSKAEMKAKDNLKCAFNPIHRPKQSLEHFSPEEIDHRERGYAMWKDKWTQTILPWRIFEGNVKETAHEDEDSGFFKITNGDVIKISDILKLVGPEAALDNPEKKNRFDGMVILVEIHYSNWKEYTWPNKVSPAYFYSFSLAPASEYKLMQDDTRQVVTDRDESKRVLYDYHGIFFMIRQHGDIGVMSWSQVTVLFLGALIIESVYRAIFTVFVLNFPRCVHIGDADLASHDDLHAEGKNLEELICRDYKIGDFGKTGATSPAARQRGKHDSVMTADPDTLLLLGSSDTSASR